MGLFNKVLGTTLLLTSGVGVAGLALSFDRAGRHLAQDGYRDVNVHVFPIQIGTGERDYVFQNHFTAKDANGQNVRGFILQSRTGVRHKVVSIPATPKA